MPRILFPAALAAACAMALSLSGQSARAETSVMKTCSARYKADKAAGKLASGESWTKYYAACAKAEGAKAPAKAAKARSQKPLTPAQKAARVRIKQCGAMWRKDKAAGKIRKGETWPQYWHRCNAALKKKA